jgi:hypothetical protein
LIAAGSVSAHVLGSILFAGSASEPVADEATRASGGYLAQLPVLIGVLVALALVGLGANAYGARRPRTGGIAPAWFLLLPPFSFMVQELAERMLHAESAPFSAIHEPAFVAALLLQLPFAFLAYLLARLLLAVAEEVGRLFGCSEPFPAAAASDFIHPLPILAAWPRTPVLASGHSQRGPPAPGFSF